MIKDIIPDKPFNRLHGGTKRTNPAFMNDAKHTNKLANDRLSILNISKSRFVPGIFREESLPQPL